MAGEDTDHGGQPWSVSSPATERNVIISIRKQDLLEKKHPYQNPKNQVLKSGK